MYNWFQNAIDPRQEGQYDPQMAQFQQNPIGNFAGNVVKGIGGVVSGLASLPGRVVSDIKNPQQAGTDVTGLITGTASGLNNLVGQPVATKNGQITGLQVPSVYEASRNFALNPVGAVGSAMVGEGLIKGGINAVKGSFAKEAPEATAQELPGGNPNDIPNNAVESFRSKYIVPTKRAGVNDLNTVDTSREILAHVKGGMPIDSVDNAPDLVTGENGIVTQMTRDTLGNIKGEIDVGGKPSVAARNILNAPENKAFFTPDEIQNVTKNVLGSEPPEGGLPLMKNPLDAYDYQRSLETLAAKYRRMDTYLTPNPKAVALSDAYQAAASTVSDEINKAVGDQGILQTIKTPDRMQALQDISPRLAQQVDNAQTVSDLRTTAKPFVRLSKMKDLSDQAANSAFGQVAQGMKKPPIQPASAALAGAGGAMMGLPGAGMGYGLGQIIDRNLAPEYNNFLSGIEKPISNAMLNQRLGNGGLLNMAGNALNTASKPFLPLLVNSANNNRQQNSVSNNENQSVQHTNGTIQPTNQSVNTSGVQSAPGRYSFTTPQQDGFMTGEDYTNQQNQLTQQIANEKLSNPQQANIDQGKLTQLENTWSNPLYQQVVKSGSTLNQFSGVANMAIPIIQKAPLGLMNLNGSYSKLLSSTNKDYQSLGILLQEIQKQTGINFAQATSPDQLVNMLDNSMSIMQNTYNSAKQQYFGGNTLNAGAPISGNTTAPPPVQAQPSGLPIGTEVHYNTNFGSAGQGLPAVPSL